LPAHLGTDTRADSQYLLVKRWIHADTDPVSSAGVHFQQPLIAVAWGGGSILEVSNMSEKLISRRRAFSLLGLVAALALPTTVLTASDAEAQAQPSPAAPAPTTATPAAPATPGMTRRQARRAGRHERREARRNARQMRREARRGMYMQSTKPIKQPQ
jgi:hypothetical protein